MSEIILVADGAYAFSDDSIFLCEDITYRHVNTIVVVIWLEIACQLINTEMKRLSLFV
jgi:hypothetical protein